MSPLSTHPPLPASQPIRMSKVRGQAHSKSPCEDKCPPFLPLFREKTSIIPKALSNTDHSIHTNLLPETPLPPLEKNAYGNDDKDFTRMG